MSIFSELSEIWKRVKTNVTYRGKVRTVLMSREAANINFTAYGINIRGSIFPDIASDFTGDKPTRTLVVKEKFEPGVAALYYKDLNKMEVGLDAVNSRMWKGYVIHEAVHAWIDKSKLRPLRVENEATAYIAQAVYYRRVGMSRQRFSSDLYLTARDIANVIIHGQTPPVSLLNKLKTVILADPTYGHLTATMVDDRNDG
jgi:hypothetical protein